MFCVKCGNELSDNSSYCSVCGYKTGSNTTCQSYCCGEENVNTYLVPAILATCFCCVPFGIVAIVYASRSNGCLSVKDFGGARAASKLAKRWFWISICSSAVMILFYIMIFVIAVASAAAMCQ